MLESRIIILNYNGIGLLEKCLPSLIRANRFAGVKAPVTILDNQSTDASRAYVEQFVPEVEWVSSPKNRFLCSYNDYAKTIREPVAILLNNDIRVDENFIPPLLKKFEDDPRTFLVAPLMMNFDGTRIDAARTKSGMRFGLFWADARYPGYEKEAHTPSETFASGGGAFSREKFVALGGFDDGYLPGIMEDADLCLQAKRAGLHLYYEPQSIVYHMGQASFKKAFGSHKTECIAHRNNFIFMWKNFSGPSFWLPHLFFLPLRLLFAILRGKWALPKGFVQALGKRRP